MATPIGCAWTALSFPALSRSGIVGGGCYLASAVNNNLLPDKPRLRAHQRHYRRLIQICQVYT